MSLSIIIPCKNEEESIGSTVNQILNYLSNKIDELEIITINDFSSDNTFEKLKVLAQTNPKIKFYNNQITGLGGAVTLGIQKSLYKFSVIVMADLSDSPEDILKYYMEIKNNDLDAVFGTRFSAHSKVLGYPKKKLFLNRAFNVLVKILFWSKYNDFTNAFKIYKTAVLIKLFPIISENFNIFLELPLKIISRNYKFSIIPISWKNRKTGVAKFKIKELSSMYLFTLIYCFIEMKLLNKKNFD